MILVILSIFALSGLVLLLTRPMATRSPVLWAVQEIFAVISIGSLAAGHMSRQSQDHVRPARNKWDYCHSMGTNDSLLLGKIRDPRPTSHWCS